MHVIRSLVSFVIVVAKFGNRHPVNNQKRLRGRAVRGCNIYVLIYSI